MDLVAQLARTEKTLKDVQGRTDTDKLRHRIQVIKDLIPLKRRETRSTESARRRHPGQRRPGMREHRKPDRFSTFRMKPKLCLVGDRNAALARKKQRRRSSSPNTESYSNAIFTGVADSAWLL